MNGIKTSARYRAKDTEKRPPAKIFFAIRFQSWNHAKPIFMDNPSAGDRLRIRISIGYVSTIQCPIRE